MSLNGPRYSSVRLFGAALAFVVMAPVFWQLTELRPAALPDGPQNAVLYDYYYPMFRYAFARIAQGEIPLWNPQLLCGTPLHADPRVGLWQPLNLLFAAMPADRAMAIHAFACLAMMGGGFALFLRSLGVSYTAAVFGGVAFAFCGASAGAMSRPPTAATLAWAPFALWALSEYHTTFRLAAAVLAGLFAGLLVLGGAFAAAAAIGLLLAAYAVYALVFPFGYDPPPLAKRIGAMFIALACAIGVSAIQWLPTLAWAVFVEQGAAFLWRLDLAALKPALPRDLLAQFFQSAPAELPRMGYLGVAALPFMLAAALHREGRRAAWFLLAAGPLAWTAFIRGQAFLPAAFPHDAFLFPAVIASAALAGLGLDALTAPGERYSFARLAPPAALVFASAAGLFVVANGLVRGVLIVVAVLIALYLVLRTRWASAACAVLLALLLFADLARANANRFNHPFANAAGALTRYEPLAAAARDQAIGARALVSAPAQDVAMPANIGLVENVRTVNGKDIALTREQRLWWERMTGLAGPDPAGAHALRPNAPAPALLNFMSARVVAATPAGPLLAGAWTGPGPALRPFRATGEGRVYINDQALPRAYWVPAVQTSGAIEETLDILTSPQFDAGRFAVADRQSPGLVRLGGEILALVPKDGALPAPSRNDATATVEEANPETVRVRLNAPAPGMLVLTDSFAPGWIADLDGERRIVIRANALFRAVHVPAGEHTITFAYRPMPFYIGAAITAATLAVMIAGALTTLARGAWPRKRRTPAKIALDF